MYVTWHKLIGFSAQEILDLALNMILHGLNPKRIMSQIFLGPLKFTIIIFEFLTI